MQNGTNGAACRRTTDDQRGEMLSGVSPMIRDGRRFAHSSFLVARYVLLSVILTSLFLPVCSCSPRKVAGKAAPNQRPHEDVDWDPSASEYLDLFDYPGVPTILEAIRNGDLPAPSKTAMDEIATRCVQGHCHVQDGLGFLFDMDRQDLVLESVAEILANPLSNQQLEGACMYAALCPDRSMLSALIPYRTDGYKNTEEGRFHCAMALAQLGYYPARRTLLHFLRGGTGNYLSNALSALACVGTMADVPLVLAHIRDHEDPHHARISATSALFRILAREHSTEFFEQAAVVMCDDDDQVGVCAQDWFWYYARRRVISELHDIGFRCEEKSRESREKLGQWIDAHKDQLRWTVDASKGDYFDVVGDR